MSFNAKSVAFYLLHCILLVGCVAPPQVHPAAFQPTVNATSVVTSTKLPDTVLQTASGRIPTTGESGLTNQTGSNVTSYGTGHVQPANEKNKDHTAPDSVASKTNVNLPGKNGVTGNATTVPTTLAPPHKKTHRPTNTSQHYVAVPINSASKSDNIIEDFAHSDSVPRPLRASEKFNPTFGAIVAAISITMAVGGYVVLMAWRKIEMDRYGNRQMLINEDDFGDIQDEDMRHFEASCIQIDP